jgi:hypothetical protein
MLAWLVLSTTLWVAGRCHHPSDPVLRLSLLSSQDLSPLPFPVSSSDTQHTRHNETPILKKTTFRPPWRHRTVGRGPPLSNHPSDPVLRLSLLSRRDLSPLPLPNRQTTLHKMLNSDGSVHLESNGQTFIYLLQSLWILASDSCHLLANVLRLWVEAS